MPLVIKTTFKRRENVKTSIVSLKSTLYSFRRFIVLITLNVPSLSKGTESGSIDISRYQCQIILYPRYMLHITSNLLDTALVPFLHAFR